MDDRRGEVREHNKKMFEILQEYVGTTLLIDRIGVEFCIEEDHDPHISGKYELKGERQRSCLLIRVNTDALSLVISGQTRKEEVIPFKLPSGSHIGSYEVQLIERLVLHDGRQFVLDIVQDERDGFRSVFLHRLVEVSKSI